MVFQSTPSVWRETLLVQVSAAIPSQFQSTPSVWRETFVSAFRYSLSPYFNPLPPCGGRLYSEARIPAALRISIHSLRVEGDRFSSCLISFIVNFNPLPPCGGRPMGSIIKSRKGQISIHSLRVEGDAAYELFFGIQIISIHSLRVEGDPCKYVRRTRLFGFQSTPSVWRETCGYIIFEFTYSNFNPLPPCGGRRVYL